MKLGVFSGTLSRKHHLASAHVGYVVGGPLVDPCGERLIARDFSPVAIFGGGLLWNSDAGM